MQIKEIEQKYTEFYVSPVWKDFDVRTSNGQGTIVILNLWITYTWKTTIRKASNHI